MVLGMNLWYGLCFWMGIENVKVIAAISSVMPLVDEKYDMVIGRVLLGGVK